MTDLVNIRRSLMAEKERVEKLLENTKQKLSNTNKEIDEALANVDKTEKAFKVLAEKLDELKKEEINLENEKKTLLENIGSLEEEIERVRINIKDEEDTISKLEGDLQELTKELAQKKEKLQGLKRRITEIKEQYSKKVKEKEAINNRIEETTQDYEVKMKELLEEEKKNIRVSPILDFLLKEVRIDIPEVDILSTLAYRRQAIGLAELKNAVAKTPPVIILKVLRNLDSKGIVKYDERLDTIELTANLV